MFQTKIVPSGQITKHGVINKFLRSLKTFMADLLIVQN